MLGCCPRGLSRLRLRDQWAETKEETIRQLIRVFNCLSSEPVEIHYNLNEDQLKKLFKQLPRIPKNDPNADPKQIHLIAYAGHGC